MSDIQSVESFTSSIKIKGLHFLPPVITSKRRIELQRCKQQAIKLERRLQTCRDLRKNLQDLLVDKPAECYQSSEYGSVTETEKRSSKKSNFIYLEDARRRTNLSHDIIDVTEYGKDGIKIIDTKLNQNKDFKNNVHSTDLQNEVQNTSNENLNQECKTKSPPTEICNDVLESIETNLSRLQSIIMPSSDLSYPVSPFNLNKSNSPPPRLIRSNSYILENPSPILLAHLDKLSQDQNKSTEQLNTNRNRSFYLENNENNYIPFENSQFSSFNTVYDADEKNNNQNPIINSNELVDPMGNISPKIEVIQTDISVQHITVDCNKNTCDELDMQKSLLELVDPSCQLIEVLKSFPKDYSKKILDLIEKQQIEQRSKINEEHFLDNSNHLSEYANFFEESTWCKSIESNVNEKNDHDKLSISPSQSLYYTLSSTCTVLPSSPIEVVDLEDEITKIELNDTKNCPEKFHHQLLENCRRKLSFKQDKFKELISEIDTIKKEWAASIIGAHIKGYLTRRLLRTERVQSLINTIKDALICALQLHTVDNIDETDVELHRRLINQVTAACHAFHDIFFSASIPEQMTIISTDRRRKVEKAKRPVSAPTPRRSGSSTKLKPRTTLSQSLTKV